MVGKLARMTAVYAFGGQRLVLAAYTQARAPDLEYPVRNREIGGAAMALAVYDDTVDRPQIGNPPLSIRAQFDRRVHRRSSRIVDHHVGGRGAAHGEANPVAAQLKSLARMHAIVPVENLHHDAG